MDIGVRSGKREVSRPDLVPQSHNCSSAVGDDAPRLLWVVVLDVVQEVILVEALLSLHLFNSFLGFNRSEMLPVSQVLELVRRKTLEGFVASHFVERCELETSQRHCSTISVYFVH